MREFAIALMNAKESMRETIAEETMHWWRQQGVLNHVHEHYKTKEKIMQFLSDIGVP